VDIKKIKLRERYAIGLLHEGHAIAKIMNAHIVPNEIAMPVQAQIDVSGNLGPVDPGTALPL